MDRISTSTRATDLYGPGKHGFKNGNLALGVTPTDLNAEWFNGVQEELMAVIEGAGLTPDAGTLNQLQQALVALLAGKQPLDATLTALAAVATVADRLIYATGPDAFATTVFTAFARSLLDDADAAAARATLGAAPLASPGFTGTPTAPTAVTGTNTTQLATTAFVQAAVAALVASSPAALNTLNELAAALGDDPNFATTMTNALAGKQPLDATLTALAGVATVADRVIYATGSNVFSTTGFSAFARTLLDDTTAGAARATLGLGDMATLNVASDMASSFSSSGYQKLPSGLIFQWGITYAGEPTTNFPIVFPNACLIVVGNDYGSSYTFNPSAYDALSFTLVAAQTGRYFAIGH